MSFAEIVGLVGGIVGLVGGTLSILSWVEDRVQRRRQEDAERAYQEWLENILMALRSGAGNAVPYGNEQRAWAFRAIAEGALERGPGVSAVMLPRGPR